MKKNRAGKILGLLMPLAATNPLHMTFGSDKIERDR